MSRRPKVLIAGAFGQGNPGDQSVLNAFVSALEGCDVAATVGSAALAPGSGPDPGFRPGFRPDYLKPGCSGSHTCQSRRDAEKGNRCL